MKVTVKSGKGVNKDLLPSELGPGVYSDCSNFRFSNGFDEKVGGIAAVFNTPSITPYWVGLYQTTAKRFLVEAGLTKVYVDDGTTATEITRILEPVAIASLNRVTNVVTMTTATPHGLTTGNVIVISGCNNGFDGTYTVTVTGASTATFADVEADAAASVIGAYRVTTSATTTAFTGAVDDRWTGGSFGGVLILNNPVDGLYYWNGDTSTKLMRLTASASSAPPIAYKADVSRPFKSFIVQLGVTMSGTKYPYRVGWSDAAEPGSLPTSFASSATNLAGNVDLAETPGFVIDCLPLGDVNIVYKQDSRYAMEFLPGDTIDVFAFRRLPGNDGLFASGCIASTPKGHVFLTASKDVKIHSGGEAVSIAEGRMRKWLESNIDSTYGSRTFLAVNSYKSEVWIVFPSTGSSVCNKAAMWNWNDDTWGIRSLSNVTFGASGLLPTSVATDSRLVLSTTAPKIGLVDSGYTDFGSTVTGTLERTGMDMDDSDRIKNLHASRIQADATAGNTASVYHGSAMTADAAPTYTSAVTHTQGTTNKLNARAVGGRFLAWKLSTAAADWKHRSVDLEFTPGGIY